MTDSDSSPIEESASEVSSVMADDGVLKFLIRLTPRGKFIFKDCIEFVKTLGSKYCVGIESVDTDKEHYHICVESVLFENHAQMLKVVREFMMSWFTAKDRTPGWNTCYNVQIAENYERGLIYCLKECKNPVSEGYLEEYLEELRQQSFIKKTRNTFKVALDALNKKFAEGNMDVREYMVDFCNIKAECNQPVRLIDAYSNAVSASIRRDHNAEDLVEAFLYKI